jgi:hypothetical protein
LVEEWYSLRLTEVRLVGKPLLVISEVVDTPVK